MKTVTLMQQSSTGRPRFIKLSVDGNVVYSEWGIVDGKVQRTSTKYDYINKGKANELSPAEAALEDFERKIDTKVREGYVPEEEFTENISEMNFDNVPTSFCPSKPNLSISDKKLQKMLDDDSAIIQKKMNGMCHFVVSDSKKNIKIYTRRLHDHTIKYPELVSAFKKQRLPANTLLLVELHVPHFKMHMEGFDWLQRVSKSDVLGGECKPDQAKAWKLQRQHPVVALVFHIPYFDGEPTWKWGYRNVYGLISEVIENSEYITTEPPMEFKTVEEIDAYLKKQEGLLEGLVVWDKDDNIEITFTGKPKRRCAYKRKTIFEDDVVAYDYYKGSGKREKLGGFLIGKYDDEGNIVELGKVGTGITDEHMEQEWTFPFVMELEYANRYPNGRYQFPVFRKKHEDKVPEEVLISDDKILGVS